MQPLCPHRGGAKVRIRISKIIPQRRIPPVPRMRANRPHMIHATTNSHAGGYVFIKQPGTMNIHMSLLLPTLSEDDKRATTNVQNGLVFFLLFSFTLLRKALIFCPLVVAL